MGENKMEALNNVDFSMSMPSTTSLVFSIAMLVIAAVVLYKLFEKAGVPSWKALIPFYNIFTLYEISWGNGFYCLLLLIPIVNFIAMAITAYKLAKAFGKGTGFAIGLFFFPMICEGILAFDSSKYLGVQA